MKVECRCVVVTGTMARLLRDKNIAQPRPSTRQGPTALRDAKRSMASGARISELSSKVSRREAPKIRTRTWHRLANYIRSWHRDAIVRHHRLDSGRASCGPQEAARRAEGSESSSRLGYCNPQSRRWRIADCPACGSHVDWAGLGLSRDKTRQCTYSTYRLPSTRAGGHGTSCRAYSHLDPTSTLSAVACWLWSTLLQRAASCMVLAEDVAAQTT